MSRLTEIRRILDENQDGFLAKRATRNGQALRRKAEEVVESGYRQEFSLDSDRILHSRAYARYIDKTQVFYLIVNDHITHRVLHVQLVSKIARTIGRFLRLNEDLIEAIALGHDIGHTPFGHDGESFLSALCVEHGIGRFFHNIQSVQFLDRVERQGAGWNLCLQTLDGILCHDGEVHNQRLVCDPLRTFAELDLLMGKTIRGEKAFLVPMTPEGCVVRLADTIAYIGRDIEDAIRLSIIKREDIPGECAKVLGDSNGTIVHNLVTDVITASENEDWVGFSEPVSEALSRLKLFNLERIYRHPEVKLHYLDLKKLFGVLFERYLEDILRDRRESVIFSGFLKEKSETYLTGHKPEEMVRDFIAGMTDQYFLQQCPESLRPSMRRIP